MVACGRGHLEVVKALLGRGAALDATDEVGFDTPYTSKVAIALQTARQVGLMRRCT